MPRGLYLHIPFCLRRCSYCDFTITVKRDAASRGNFFAALEREAQEAVRRYGRIRFDTLYFGGGTPSSLDASEVERVFQILTAQFDFPQLKEFTCEVNPGDIDENKIRMYEKIGISRISIGAQAFQDSLLQHMNRPHTAEQIRQVFHQFRQKGFKNISLDLIIKLPGQSLRDWESSLDETLDLGPDHVSIYDLDVHEKTVYGAKRRRGELVLPDEDQHLAMFDKAEEVLAGQGYCQYEVFNFAKPGAESRHNLIYWTDGEYLGLGPGAYSYMEGVRYQFARDIPGYLKKCGLGDWSRDVEDRLTHEENEKERVITGLRLKEGIRLADFPMLRESLQEKIPELIRQGFAECPEGRLRLTSQGRRIPEAVLFELLSSRL